MKLALIPGAEIVYLVKTLFELCARALDESARRMNGNRGGIFKAESLAAEELEEGAKSQVASDRTN